LSFADHAACMTRIAMRCNGEIDRDGGWLKRQMVVTGSAAKGVAKFIVLTAKTVGRTMLFEAVHTVDPSFDLAMVLFQSIVQIHIRSVADIAAQS
jgi:hypothetical protein